MKRSFKRGIATTAIFVTVMNLSACGYFLYPERKGQAGGRVDPAVVILDSAALLFGLIPGLVAFAVDITNGTIYLPAGNRSVLDRHVTGVTEDSAETVVDENGQVWLRFPLNKAEYDSTQLEVLSARLSGVSGRQVNAEDIIWLRDLAEFRTATVFQTAAR
ncbi:hypothetical protein MO867_02815 [Microbulbifer sp. OS29]|uniref:Uncharacterized protein n=1 Tax=Microbulbifer okhotskensis TaxID=2926617 RepID=A0A9X2EPB1_9GAMM|nr:hypothetical protein [Microbulbifer okhotskensis]MCO1333263.1 hypothetical protein [Microbulbifer okhotskensis]